MGFSVSNEISYHPVLTEYLRYCYLAHMSCRIGSNELVNQPVFTVCSWPVVVTDVALRAAQWGRASQSAWRSLQATLKPEPVCSTRGVTRRTSTTRRSSSRPTRLYKAPRTTLRRCPSAGYYCLLLMCGYFYVSFVVIYLVTWSLLGHAQSL